MADQVFYGCTSLRSIAIPEGVGEMGEAVFKGCTSLKRVEIPASVKRIGRQCFGGCTSLEEVFFRGNKDDVEMEEDVFADCPNDIAFIDLKARASEKVRDRVEAALSSADSRVTGEARKPDGGDELVSYFRVLSKAEEHVQFLKDHLTALYSFEMAQAEADARRLKINRNAAEKNVAEARSQVEAAKAKRDGCRRDIKSVRCKSPSTLEPLVPPSSRAQLPPKPVKPERKPLVMPLPKPEPPQLEKPGLFGKKKVEERNAQLEQEYRSRLAEYESEKRRLVEEHEAEHRHEIKKYDGELAAYHEEVKAVVMESISEAESAAETALAEAEARLKILLEEAGAVKHQTEAESLALTFVRNEIAEAEESLVRALAFLQGLYSCDAVHPKYRNLLAVCTIYDYLDTGRCDGLAGPGGAYNLYENETRANVVIARLESIEGKLDDLIVAQYSAHAALTAIGRAVSHLGIKMQAAVDELHSISEKTDSLAGSVSSIEQSNKAIAYHTEAAAHYAKVNAEIAAAPSFGVIW